MKAQACKQASQQPAQKNNLSGGLAVSQQHYSSGEHNREGEKTYEEEEGSPFPASVFPPLPCI